MVADDPAPARRHYPGKLADPARWQVFAARVGDIVVCTPPKSGTTWVQAIIALLISGDPQLDADLSRSAPWLDISIPEVGEVMARLAAQTHRRQIKTHTPFDGIPFWHELRYICVYRHPIDVHLSFRAHVSHMRQRVLADVFPEDVTEGFHLFLNGTHRDGGSLASIIDHYRSALALDQRENVLRLHYADMCADLPRAFARIAAHIAISHPPEVTRALIAAADFTAMKANADRFAMAAKQGFWRDDADFFHSGTSRKWLGVLPDSALAAYDARMAELLPPSERHWLEWGSL